MSEKEIREVLRGVCHDLDRYSRRVVRQGVRKIVLPTVLGAGLAMTGCGERASVPVYGVPADAGVEAGSRDMMYGAPDWPPKDDQQLGPTPDMVYGVADGPIKDDAYWTSPDIPPYMAPDAWPADQAKPDAGATPPYMAPPFPEEDE